MSRLAILGGWGVLLALTLLGIFAQPGSPWAPYAAHDGAVHAWNQVFALGWSDPLSLGPFNPFAGLGSVYPVNPPWLNPGSWALIAGLPRPHALALSFLIQAGIFAGGLYALARALGVGRLAAHVAAWLAWLLLIPPFAGLAQVLNFLSSSPVNLLANAQANFGLAAAIALLTGPAEKRWRYALALLLIAAWGAMSALFLLGKHAVLYGAILLAVMIARRPAAGALLWLAASAGVIGAIFWASGLAEYARTAGGLASRMLFTPSPGEWAEMTDPARLWTAIRGGDLCSMGATLLCFARPHAVWQVICLAAAALVALGGRGPVRVFAVVLILWVGAVQIYGLSRIWVAPHVTINHVGLTHLPLLGIPLAWAVDRWRLTRMLAVSGTVVAMVGLFALAVPGPARMAGWAAMRDVTPRPVFPTGALPPPIAHARAEIALAPDAPFRGALAFIPGSPGSPMRIRFGYGGGPVDPGLLGQIYDHWLGHYGNAGTNADLWMHALPTINDYVQSFSLPMLAFQMAALSGPRDVFHHNTATPTRAVWPILAALGIRFVLTDDAPGAPASVHLAAEASAPGAVPMRLYEIAGANRGDWSPTEIRVEPDWRATVQALASADLRRQVFLRAPLPGPVHPARLDSMTLRRNGWRITADAPDGDGLLLLPVQFSQCWVWRGTGTVELLRANAIQTALRFAGRIDGTLERGGWAGRWACRRADLAAARADGLAEPFDRSSVGRARLRAGPLKTSDE